MNRVKLCKHYNSSSYEKIFNVTSYNAGTGDDMAGDANVNYNDDSVEDMRDTITDLIDKLDTYSNQTNDIISSTEEWREIALDMWEQLPPEIQKNYVMTWGLSEEKLLALENAFKLEVLKDL